MLALANIPTMTAAVAIMAASAAKHSAGYLHNSIESMENSLKTLRIFLVAFTWMVGVGLVLEYKTQLLFICRGLLKVVRLKSNSFDRCQLRKLVWHSLGALLVTFGVLGEFWIEFKQYGEEGEFSRASASARADLNAKAAEADATAKGFQSQIAAAQLAAAESKKEAESEHLARVKLQKELQPRRLTSAQKEKLTSLLRNKPKNIFILTMGDDTETADLANDIGDALNKAGWKTFFSVRFSFEHGIEVGTSRESDMVVLMPAIEELKSALSAAGLSSRTTLFDPNDTHLAGRFEKNVLCLVIDHKPVIRAPQ